MLFVLEMYSNATESILKYFEKVISKALKFLFITF